MSKATMLLRIPVLAVSTSVAAQITEPTNRFIPSLRARLRYPCDIHMDSARFGALTAG